MKGHTEQDHVGEVEHQDHEAADECHRLEVAAGIGFRRQVWLILESEPE